MVHMNSLVVEASHEYEDITNYHEAVPVRGESTVNPRLPFNPPTTTSALSDREYDDIILSPRMLPEHQDLQEFNISPCPAYIPSTSVTSAHHGQDTEHDQVQTPNQQGQRSAGGAVQAPGVTPEYEEVDLSRGQGSVVVK